MHLKASNGAATFYITTLNIMTFSKTIKMFSVVPCIMPCNIMLSTVMLSVIILRVEVPIKVTFNITTHSVISDTKQGILSEG